MSTHEVKVIRIENITPHDKADRLELVTVWGYTCVVRKGQFKVGDLAVFVEPDYVVDLSRPEFAFLSKTGSTRTTHRIAVSRLRGVYSSGLLVGAPEGAREGDNVIKLLGIERYEPPESGMTKGCAAEHGPEVVCPKYDLENLKKFHSLLVPGEECIITAKLHGCFQRTAKVKTPNGHTIISKIKTGDVVYGYDHLLNKIVKTTVKNTFKNGKTENWLQIKTERVRDSNKPTAGNGFIQFKVTPQHEIFSISENRYKRAADLTENEVLQQTAFETRLTKVQKQILIGKMLGDGSSLKKRPNHVVFGHSLKDEEYVDYCAKILKPIIASKRMLTSGYGSKIKTYRTKNMRTIQTLFSNWYQNKINKQIPNSIISDLTPISLAFWYMDDGSLAHSNYQKDRANFAVCAFSKESCEVLQRGLKKFGINSTLFQSGQNKSHNRLRLNHKDAYVFFNLIAPYVHPSMRRKLPMEFRAVPFIEITDPEINTIELSTFSVKIKTITKFTEKCNREKYDIQTGTGNYYCHNILVHNCSGRFVYHNDRMYCGSRTTWRMKPGTVVPGSVFKNPWYKSLFSKLTGYKLARPDSNGQIVQKNAWWEALAQNPWIEEFCKANPGVVIYGEVVGPTIQGENYHYGLQKNQVGFFVFDIIENGKWINNAEFVNYGFFKDRFSCLEFVPTLYHGPYNVEIVSKLAEEVETFNNANHIREGVVVKVIDERYDSGIGRVALKYVSNTYLEKG